MQYKEFLNSNDNYNLVMLPEHAGDDERSGLIGVPDGADTAVSYVEGDLITFYKNNMKMFSNKYTGSEWEYADYNSKLGSIVWQRHTQPEELPFIDDEQSVQETLNERQSSYGCFEDVALVTENIIDALKQVNYSKMPKTHKMAMYMIASKMARIVNGDFNHKDSWHDIQGYAKLIEDLL